MGRRKATEAAPERRPARKPLQLVEEIPEAARAEALAKHRAGEAPRTIAAWLGQAHGVGLDLEQLGRQLQALDEAAKRDEARPARAESTGGDSIQDVIADLDEIRSVLLDAAREGDRTAIQALVRTIDVKLDHVRKLNLATGAEHAQVIFYLPAKTDPDTAQAAE